jgi:hypothetical protein
VKKLSQILESINEVDSIVREIEFSTPEDFKKYKAKHKMRPGTVVKVAGKDKVVDEPKGKKAKSKPMPQPSDFGGDMDKYTDALNKRMKDDEKSSSDEPKKPKDFNGIDYKEMEGKEPGVWDRQAVNNLSASNPEIVKQLGLTGDNEKDSPILKKLDLKTISSIIDKYGDDYDKERHLERLKDDHGIGGKPDVDPKTDKEMQKVAGDANEKMAKDEFKGTLDSDPMYAGELYSNNLKNVPEEDREMGQEAIFALQDVEMGLISASDAEWAKEFLTKNILPHIKEGKDFDLSQLSKITTRYTNRINEAGFPNQLRRGFIDHSKSSAHGYAIEEVDAILKVYKEITELLTYGKFYDDKKPNKRRYDLSALVADINTAVIGQKRLGGYQNRFEGIFKKFTNMINTQLKREEKGQKADYIKAIRASQLDQVKSIFKNSTMTSVRKQKDLY